MIKTYWVMDNRKIFAGDMLINVDTLVTIANDLSENLESARAKIFELELKLEQAENKPSSEEVERLKRVIDRQTETITQLCEIINDKRH